MDIQAKNGFRNLPRYTQNNIIEEQRRHSRSLIQEEGCFYEEEAKEVMVMIDAKINKIYRN